jgi:hypothetical protein
MIHRQYVCKLAPANAGFPDLDIVVSLPGSSASPVGLQASYPAGPLLTIPPVGWTAAGGLNWYYEVRARALRIPNPVGSAGAVARFRLGGYLAVTPLADNMGADTSDGFLPGVVLSASLAPNPIPAAALGAEITAFADPAYGPVIRLRNFAALYVRAQAAAYYLVSIGVAENKDEDWSGLGHA